MFAVGALLLTACGSSTVGTTTVDRDELVLIGMCAFWEATISDDNATDEERSSAQDSFRENDCTPAEEIIGRPIESLLEDVESPSTSSPASYDQTVTGALAFVADPVNVIVFQEMWGFPSRPPLVALEGRLDGDCAAVTFESDELKQYAADAGDPFEPWTIFLRWTDGAWEPVSITGIPDAISLVDRSSDICVG